MLKMKNLILLSILFSVQAYADQSGLCGQIFNDSVQFANHVEKRPNAMPNTLTLVTWNAHKYLDKNYFYDLKEIGFNSDVLMVQEAMHSTGWQAAFASHFNFSFSFFKSFCTKENLATGVQTASRFQLLDNKNIVSSDTEPVTFTPKATGLSHIEVEGHGRVFLVNTHALNFNLGSLFERQIDLVASYIAAEKGPVIWAGDFNTWSPARKAYLNMKTKGLGLAHVVLSNDSRNLVLDHIYVRGFSVVSAQVLMKQTSSDHQPLQAVLKFNN